MEKTVNVLSRLLGVDDVKTYLDFSYSVKHHPSVRAPWRVQVVPPPPCEKEHRYYSPFYVMAQLEGEQRWDATKVRWVGNA